MILFIEHTKINSFSKLPPDNNLVCSSKLLWWGKWNGSSTNYV